MKMSSGFSIQAFNPLFKGKKDGDAGESKADPEDQIVVANAGDSKAEQGALESISKVPKWLGAIRVCLFVTCLALAIVMIIAVQRMLWLNPYEPVFWLFIFSMIFYWVLSFLLVGISMKVYLLRSAEEGVKTCSKESLIREVKRVEFWIFFASLICTFACMILMLQFALPELFFPSGGLTLNRLAGVTSTSASVWIRNPHLGENAAVALEVRLNDTSDPFIPAGTTGNLNFDNDYSAFLRLSGLTPSTAYEVRFQNQTETLSFRTNPVTGSPVKFSFYFGSCFLHNFPFFQEAPGFGYVLDVLKPDLFTFLGDFIYSDIPFFRGDDLESYKSLYRHALLNSHVERLMKKVPNYNMWDDHEVQNDYPDLRPSNIKRAGRASFGNAIDNAWQNYLGGGNPVTFPGKTWFNFDYGDTSFFFVDTRVNRTSNKLPDDSSKTILGEVQKADFKQWLLDVNLTAKFKFIMSPLALTHDFPSVIDSWGGFKTERDEIFEFIRENFIEGVVFFTGDSHFAYAVELGGAPGGIRGGLYEFSASPISAFDSTLGGVYTDPPFKPESEREDIVIFETTARKGAISLLGHTRVDTTKPVPEISVDFYDSTTLIFTMTLNGTMLRPWAAS